MPWRGPSYDGEFPSLGWAVVDWVENYFSVPDGPTAGQPIRLTDEQVTTIVRWYALDDRGRRVYRRGAKRAAKGKGKSPEAAMMSLAELCGPTRFDGWDARGEPVGVEPTAPLVQVAAVSEDSAISNTYGYVYELLRNSPIVDDAKLDVGLTRVFTSGRPGVLEPVTAAAGAREGARLSFAVLDETHLWFPSNGGRKLAAVLRRNAAKVAGTTWETTNAYVIGQDSVAEDTHKAVEKGLPGILYECVTADPQTQLDDDESLRSGLMAAYEGAPWVDIDRLMAEIRDPGTTPEDARRFYLNLPVEIDLESWLSEAPGVWDRCLAPDLTLEECDRPVGFIDMSLRHDSTAVGWVAKHPSGRTVVRCRVFQKDERLGKVDFQAVADEIRSHALRLQASAIVYDPRFFELIAQTLEDEGLPMVEFPQSLERMTPAAGNLYELIVGGELAHDGDPLLGAHVRAAVRKVTERGFTFTKGKSKSPIDACVGLAMGAYHLVMGEEPAVVELTVL